jgi:hypothetical protein
MKKSKATIKWQPGQAIPESIFKFVGPADNVVGG